MAKKNRHAHKMYLQFPFKNTKYTIPVLKPVPKKKKRKCAWSVY